MNIQPTHCNVTDDTMITWNLANQKEYAFTLRRTSLKKAVIEEDYLTHIDKFKKYGIILVDYSFEQTAGLHMHGILQIPNSFDIYKRFRVRGWNIKLDELYNKEGWIMYYLKDQNLNQVE